MDPTITPRNPHLSYIYPNDGTYMPIIIPISLDPENNPYIIPIHIPQSWYLNSLPQSSLSTNGYSWCSTLVFQGFRLKVQGLESCLLVVVLLFDVMQRTS